MIVCSIFAMVACSNKPTSTTSTSSSSSKSSSSSSVSVYNGPDLTTAEKYLANYGWTLTGVKVNNNKFGSIKGMFPNENQNNNYTKVGIYVTSAMTEVEQKTWFQQIVTAGKAKADGNNLYEINFTKLGEKFDEKTGYWNKTSFGYKVGSTCTVVAWWITSDYGEENCFARIEFSTYQENN